MRARAGLLLAVLLLPVLCALVPLLFAGDALQGGTQHPSPLPPSDECAGEASAPAELPAAVSSRTDIAAARGDEAATLQGIVLAEEGGPIAGASIVVRRNGDGICVHSGADGTFQLTLQPVPGQTLFMTVSAPGRTSWFETLEPVDQPRAVALPALVLGRGAAVQGWLFSATGGEAAAGRVVVSWEWNRRIVELHADGRGRFASDTLAPGRVRLWATAADNGWTDLGTCWLAAGQLHDCGAVRLQAGRVVTVTCIADGAPVRGAWVTVYADEDRDICTTVTADEVGRAVVRGLSPEMDLVEVWATGYCHSAAVIGAATRVLEVELSRLPQLRGHVRSAATGMPLRGARCVLTWSAPERLAPPAEPLPAATPVAECTDDGSFALTAYGTGTYDLWVKARGHAPARLAVDVRVREPVQVLLSPAATITGRVLRHTGAPASSARLQVWTLGKSVPPPASAGEALLASLGPAPASAGGQVLATAHCDARGCFRIEDLPAGPCVLAAVDGSASARVELELGPAATCEPELRLSVPASVRGHVRGIAAGTAAFAVLLGGADATRTARVAADGSFAFAEVTPGRYLVRAFAEPLAPRLHEFRRSLLTPGAALPEPDVTVHAGASLTCELTLTEPSTGTVSGTATCNGVPAAGGSVSIEPTDGGSGDRCLAATVGPGGTFELAWVPAGRYRATLHAPGRTPAVAWPVVATAEATVTAGARVTLSLAGSDR